MARKTKATFTVEIEYKGPERKIQDLFAWSNRIEKVRFKDIQSETEDIGVQPQYSDEEKILRNFLKEACKTADLKYTRSRSQVGAGEYNIFYVTTSSRYRDQVHGDIAIAFCGGVIEFAKDKKNPANFKLSVFDRINWKKQEKAKQIDNPYSHQRSYSRWLDLPAEEEDLTMASPTVKDEIVEILKRWGFKYQQNFNLGKMKF